MTFRAYVLLGMLVIWSGACTAAPVARPGRAAAASGVLAGLDRYPAPSSDTSAHASALIRFVDVDEGATVEARLDPVSGLPVASLQFELSDSRLPVGLDADGLLVALDTSERAPLPSRMELEWTPWHGNGRYILNLQLLDWQNRSVPSSRAITVNVVGIPENVPTVASRFIELYRARFGLNLTAPVFARYNAAEQAAGDLSRWVSAAYVGNRLYEIGILDNGSITSESYVLDSDESGGFCRPSGTIRMLAIVVDYGNTGLDPAQVETMLHAGLEAAEASWAGYALEAGLSETILEVELTTFTFGVPPRPGRYVTPDEIRAAGGPDPAAFDVLAEIDLDKTNAATGQYGGLGVSLGDDCRPSGSRRTNLAFTVRDRNSLERAMARLVFEHEFIHALGWMHWWPNGDGDGRSWVHSGAGWLPYRMFGWTDPDGDGVIEIRDSTPYGLIQ